MTFWGPECHNTMQADVYTFHCSEDFTAISDDEESTRSTDTEEQSGEELQIYSDSDVPDLTSGDSSGDDYPGENSPHPQVCFFCSLLKLLT